MDWKPAKIIWITASFCVCAGCSKQDSRDDRGQAVDGNTNEQVRLSLRSRVTTNALVQSESLSTTNIPEHLQVVLSAPTTPPSPTWRMALKREDVPALLMIYRRETALSNKLATTMALGFIGDEEAVQDLQNTILYFKTDHVLHLHEEYVMLATVEALGFLAKKSDSAFQFLVKAIDPSFWDQNVSWRAEDQSSAFAGRALCALARSERKDADGIFDQVKQQPFINGSLLDSALIDAVFMRDLIQQKGADYVKRAYATESLFDDYAEWRETENGKEFRRWRQQWRKEHPKEAGLLPQ